MTRVLVVEVGDGLWGAQRYLLRLAPLLAERDVAGLLAAPEETATAQAWQTAGFPLVPFASPLDRSIRSAAGRIRPVPLVRELIRTVGHGVRLARVARREEIEVIHGNSHWNHLDAAIAGVLCGRPAILHLHEEVDPGASAVLRGIAVRLATQSIAVSDAVARQLPAWAGSRVVAVRNGVDIDRFTPGSADPNVRAQLTPTPTEPVALVMSRLDPKKGVDAAIRAVAAANAMGGVPVHLAIAGSGSLDKAHQESLRTLADERLGDRVRFLGARDDVVELLRASDLLIIASRLEGLPLSLLEAQACGVPAVAFPTAGIPEVLVDGRNGWLLSGPDEHELAVAIRALGDDPARRAELGANARWDAVAHSSLAGQADRVAWITRSVVESGAGRRRVRSLLRRRPLALD